MVESVTSELWVVASRRPIRPSVRPYVHTYVRETCFRVALPAILIDRDRDPRRHDRRRVIIGECAARRILAPKIGRPITCVPSNVPSFGSQ